LISGIRSGKVDVPTYRVYFWADDGGAREEWELAGAAFHEALQWILTQAKGRPHRIQGVALTT
jgi:hypothetical protein